MSARVAQLLLMLFAAALLAGCAVRLAPDYDVALLNGITETNTAALKLFADVETGSDATEFPDYRDDYATAIAAFEGLRLRADARPIPPLADRISKMPFLSSVCDPAQAPAQCLNATGNALKEVVDVLRTMRDRHRTQGLSPDAVQLLRGRYDQEIHQALTVETALDR